jgi:hypothetical protein
MAACAYERMVRGRGLPTLPSSQSCMETADSGKGESVTYKAGEFFVSLLFSCSGCCMLPSSPEAVWQSSEERGRPSRSCQQHRDRGCDVHFRHVCNSLEARVRRPMPGRAAGLKAWAAATQAARSESLQ